MKTKPITLEADKIKIYAKNEGSIIKINYAELKRLIRKLGHDLKLFGGIKK